MMPNTGSLIIFLLAFSTFWTPYCKTFRPATPEVHLRTGFYDHGSAIREESRNRNSSWDFYTYGREGPYWPILHSKTSIETVIHTGDCEEYDVNCIQYRKARYWRELSTPELEEEIRKVRKVLAKIDIYRKTKNPALLPSSLGNTRRTLAQLLFIRHERHLAMLRENEQLKKARSILQESSAAGDAHG